MSLAAPEVPKVARPATEVSARDGLRAFQVPGHVFRWLVGILLCCSPLLAVLAVGWTFRLMRRSVLRRWWRCSDLRGGLRFDEFAAMQGPDVARKATPRWFLSEKPAERLYRTTPDGKSPGRLLRLSRLPGVLTAGLFANARTGLVALTCTAALVLPGGLFLLAGWEYGWNISFYKGYEQAFVGRTVAIIGALLLAAAMLYVPMAWAHLATTGDVRAFFQFRLVGRLIRERLGSLTILAALAVILSLPWLAFWSAVIVLPNIFPEIESATPERVAQLAFRYRLIATAYLFPAYVTLHLMAARIYAGAVLALLRRRPDLAETLPSSLLRPLDDLDLLPESAPRHRHPLLAVVLATGGRGTRAALWIVSFVLWLLVPAQMLVAQFFVAHPIGVWLNPPLILLPGLFGVPAAG